MEQVAADLSPIIGKEEADILHILTNPLPNGEPRGSAILKRRIEKDESML